MSITNVYMNQKNTERIQTELSLRYTLVLSANHESEEHKTRKNRILFKIHSSIICQS
jgi:hypothetical protein